VNFGNFFFRLNDPCYRSTMDLQPLPFRSPLIAYEQQAAVLLDGHRAGDPAAIDLFHGNHPQFLDEKIIWRRKFISASEICDASLTLEDARLALARSYGFLDWSALAAHVAAVTQDGPVHDFEAAVEAVVNGDLTTLEAALRRNPTLIRARSTRICNLAPPVHGATLLHYVAANGVEGYRQKTPPNAVAIARALLTAGAEPDAEADLYGGGATTMSLLVSSDHPARAGLSAPLVELLLDFGAEIEGRGVQEWAGPLFTALAFGKIAAAEALARRGACIQLAEAAGLGLEEKFMRLLPGADAGSRHRALALAAQYGHDAIVRALLDAGEDLNRFNPPGTHGHSTPLHQAALNGHEAVVQLLVERGARLDLRDKVWLGTPLGWAEHGCQAHIIQFLRSRGAVE